MVEPMPMRWCAGAASILRDADASPAPRPDAPYPGLTPAVRAPGHPNPGQGSRGPVPARLSRPRETPLLLPPAGLALSGSSRSPCPPSALLGLGPSACR